MLPLSDAKRRRLEEALGLPDRASALVETLRIDGRDVTSLKESLTYRGEDNREGGAPGMVLEATLHGRLPASDEGRPVTVDLEIGGVKLRTFTGFLARPIVGRTRTQIEAASAGFWLDKTAIRQELNYESWWPSDVVHDVVGQRVPYSGIDIPETQKPAFTRTDDEGGAEAFDETTKVSEVLAEVREECRLRVRDDGRGYLRGIVDDPLSRPGRPAFVWTVGEEIVLSESGEGFEPELNPEDRYSSVWCYRTDEDGEIETLAEVPIDHGNRVPPPANTPFEIELSEAGPDRFQVGEEAGQQEAERLSRGEYSVPFATWFIPPHLERDDRGVIVEPTENGESRWFARLDTHAHTISEGSRGAEYAATLTLQRAVSIEPGEAPERLGTLESFGPALQLVGADHLSRPYAASEAAARLDDWTAEFAPDVTVTRINDWIAEVS